MAEEVKRYSLLLFIRTRSDGCLGGERGETFQIQRAIQFIMSVRGNFPFRMRAKFFFNYSVGIVIGSRTFSAKLSRCNVPSNYANFIQGPSIGRKLIRR